MDKDMKIGTRIVSDLENNEYEIVEPYGKDSGEFALKLLRTGKIYNYKDYNKEFWDKTIAKRAWRITSIPIPDKWAIRRTKENYQVVNNYFNELYNTRAFVAKGEYQKFDGTTYNDYLHFPKIKKGTTAVEAWVDRKHTEISFEDFIKYVLNKPKKEKSTENMKKIKEYKVKKENLVYTDRYNEPQKLTYTSFPKDSIISEYFSSIGLLDNEDFFEKIYEEEFKKGDFVFTLPKSGGYGMHPKDEEKVFEIEDVDDDYLILTKISNTITTSRVQVRKQDVRLATKEEIEAYKEENDIKVGDWVVVTESYGTNYSRVGHFAQVKRIDIMARVRYLVYNSPDFSGSSWCIDVRKATLEEIKSNTTIKIAGYEAERFGDSIKFGCQTFTLEELKIVQRLVQSPIYANIRIDNIEITYELITKFINKLLW